MKIEKTFDLPHPRELVWSKLNDVHFVAQCLPGASIVEDRGNNNYKGRMAVKVGPMAASFDGDIAIDSRRDDWTAVVSGKGSDTRSSSRASGSMTYKLADGASPGSTRVEVVSDINLAGPLAQFGKGGIGSLGGMRVDVDSLLVSETCRASRVDVRLVGRVPAATTREHTYTERRERQGQQSLTHPN